MIDLKKLEKLVGLMVDNDLTVIDLADEKESVTLKRGGEATGPVQVVAPAAIPAPAAPAPAADAAAASGGSGKTIDSPMVGSFYSASSPDAEPFIKVGDSVGPDTVICIIEAMKVFNEIKAETTGTITKILVTSGDTVEFGQPLFEIS